MKKILFFIVLAGLISFSTVKIYAEEQFTTEYFLNYEILDSGETLVNQKIRITNNVNDVIPTNYSLTLRQIEVYDIKVSSNQTTIEPEIKTQNKETIMKIRLQNQLLGTGNVNELDISYKSKDLAIKSGEVWNVYIPQVTGLNNVKTYDLTLNTPKSLGPKIFVSPQPDTETTEGEINKYLFSKEKLKMSGISASFGKYQSINFNLKYDLKNNSYFWSDQEIAIPPQITGKQDVFISDIQPKPKSLKQDKDGNLIATIGLGPKENVNVTVTGTAKILGKQIDIVNGGSVDIIPKQIREDYTKKEKYWDVEDEEVQSIAKELYDPSINTVENAKKVYDYVVENLDYDFGVLTQDSVVRKGAKEALTNSISSACMEFTDVFITLTRAMGIPARELNGYAFTNDSNSNPLSINFKNSDFLHAWPEFYDPNLGWIAVDPTWGNTSGLDYFTKMDTNHFVFVIKGLDSEIPLPAGAYRFNNDSKQVDVSFTITANEVLPQVKLKKVISINPYNLIKGRDYYKVTNITGSYVRNINDRNIDILPMQSSYIDLEDTNNISYTDFNNNKVYLEADVEKGFTFWPSPKEVSYLALIVIVLCTTVYFLRARLKAQKI